MDARGAAFVRSLPDVRDDQSHRSRSWTGSGQARDGAASERGFQVVNVDATVILEQPKLRVHIATMRENLARTLGVDTNFISVKAKTGEGLDAIGRGEAVSAEAVVLLQSESE